ncbi:MAG: hypothetical protein GX754_11280 [Clostridiaceae bacterium]|nr:hypothetical protein [Clostridiaceae bacterium]
MKKFLVILFIIFLTCLTGCVYSQNRPIGSNMHQDKEVTPGQKTEEPPGDDNGNRKVIAESDAKKSLKELLEPIYIDIESPDKAMRTIVNESGLMLVSNKYEVLKVIINKEQQVGQGFVVKWSPGSNKIFITQYGEFASAFSIYDITNGILTPIKNAKGLAKAEFSQDWPYDWYYMTSPIEWLDNARVLFNVFHLKPLDSNGPLPNERGYRADIYVYSLEDNSFINLTNRKDGEYCILREIDRERQVLIIDIFVLGSKDVELEKTGEAEIPY